jgi:3-keto steroid reductase
LPAPFNANGYKQLIPFSGLGLSIAERLIDEFLDSSTRPSSEHLVLIISTRTPRKTGDTINNLRNHLKEAAGNTLQGYNAEKADISWQDVAARVHFLGVELDLCSLRQVYSAAALLNGEGPGLRSPDTNSGGKGLEGVKIPRLDVLYCNAGIGGWTGMRWVQAVWGVLTGMPDSLTYWAYHTFPSPAAVAPQQLLPANDKVLKENGAETSNTVANKRETEEPPLGEVFCANVFGHYILAHELMPLLSTPEDRASGDRGRIVWVSSIEPLPEDLSLDDLQCLHGSNPYNSSKRITDVLALSSSLKGVQGASANFFVSESKKEEEETMRPELYVTHPGVCHTNISGMNAILSVFMLLAFYVARFTGSVWHPIAPYKGAKAPVWLGLAPQAELNEAEEISETKGSKKQGVGKGKWGSGSDWLGNEAIYRTEVGGWGFSGRLGEEAVGGDGKKRLGRKKGAEALTEEARVDFEVLGREVWKQMEELRGQWEDRLEIRR